MSAETLIAEFTPRSAYPGNLLILHCEDALHLVARARELNVQILGVDSFRLQQGGIQPVLEETLDMQAELSHTNDSWAEATRFLRARKARDLVFEVVLG